jgi:hypothetical protein
MLLQRQLAYDFCYFAAYRSAGLCFGGLAFCFIRRLRLQRVLVSFACLRYDFRRATWNSCVVMTIMRHTYAASHSPTISELILLNPTWSEIE